RPRNARNTTCGNTAGEEILVGTLAIRRGPETRSFDRLEQTIVAESAERPVGNVNDIDLSIRAVDHLFNLGERAVIGLGRDRGSGLLRERLEIRSLLRLTVSASPSRDIERGAAPAQSRGILGDRASARREAHGKSRREPAMPSERPSRGKHRAK